MTPCYGCLERNVGCHARCEKYKVWETARRKKRNIIAENRFEQLRGARHRKNLGGKLIDSF